MASREYHREYVRAHKEMYKRATLEARRKRVAVMHATRDRPCMDCGQDPLPDKPHHFHHRDPGSKDRTISTIAQNGGMADLYAEMEKCDVLCFDCHWKNHAAELYHGICPVCGVAFTKDAKTVRANRKKGRSGPYCSVACGRKYPRAPQNGQTVRGVV